MQALADYLETKRTAFPRFYFVAPTDLLDILSKGSNPQAIVRCGAAVAGGWGAKVEVHAAMFSKEAVPHAGWH